jgi:hypothetical protein
MEQWHDFYVAVAGAAAALAGLVIVAISINVQEILKEETLPALASHTLAMLTESLIAAAIVLVPGEPAIVGTILAIVTVICWIMSVQYLVGYARSVSAWVAVAPDPPSSFDIIMGGVSSQAATLPLAAGGVLFAFGNVTWASSLIAAGILISFFAAIRNVWILLIEILR